MDDLLKGGNILAGLALGAVALALPAVLSGVRAPMAALVRTGVLLFVEAEFELEGEAIEALVDATAEALSAALAAPGTRAARRQQAEAAIQQFKHRARTRSRRHGRDERDRARRYHRHLTALKRAVVSRRDRLPADQRGAMDRLIGTIAEDW